MCVCLHMRAHAVVVFTNTRSGEISPTCVACEISRLARLVLHPLIFASQMCPRSSVQSPNAETGWDRRAGLPEPWLMEIWLIITWALPWNRRGEMEWQRALLRALMRCVIVPNRISSLPPSAVSLERSLTPRPPLFNVFQSRYPFLPWKYQKKNFKNVKNDLEMPEPPVSPVVIFRQTASPSKELTLLSSAPSNGRFISWKINQ